MKTGLLAVVFSVLLGQGAVAQVFVNNVNINELDITYCQLMAINAGLVGKAVIRIDYGQPRPLVKRPNITGPDKQLVSFNSVVDALNFMTSNGWELVSTHVMADKDGDSNQFIYLLRKREGYSVK